jgi:N-acetylneuraminic acid mutarotase
VRQKAVAFVIAGKGYVTTGDFGGLKSDTWEYDVTLDEWTERTSFEGKSRNNAVAFTLGDRGFIATGVNGASAFYDDLFEFKPADEFNEDD